MLRFKVTNGKVMVRFEVYNHRSGGTDPAAAPKLNRETDNSKFFAVVKYTNFLINNESTNDTTYYFCKTIAL